MDQLPGQPDWWPKNAHITIDDGPRISNDSLPKILDALDKFGVKATFFFRGAKLDEERRKDPTRLKALLERMIASGHQIAYHSYSHTYDKSTKEEILAEIDRFQVALNTALGRDYKVTVGRMPGGKYTRSQAAIDAFAERGMEPPKYWHIETKPWERNIRKKPDSYASVINDLNNEGQPHIMLLHEYKDTGDDLTRLISEIETQNTRPLVVARREASEPNKEL